MQDKNGLMHFQRIFTGTIETNWVNFEVIEKTTFQVLYLIYLYYSNCTYWSYLGERGSCPEVWNFQIIDAFCIKYQHICILTILVVVKLFVVWLNRTQWHSLDIPDGIDSIQKSTVNIVVNKTKHSYPQTVKLSIFLCLGTK